MRKNRTVLVVHRLSVGDSSAIALCWTWCQRRTKGCWSSTNAALTIYLLPDPLRNSGRKGNLTMFALSENGTIRDSERESSAEVTCLRIFIPREQGTARKQIHSGRRAKQHSSRIRVQIEAKSAIQPAAPAHEPYRTLLRTAFLDPFCRVAPLLLLSARE